MLDAKHEYEVDMERSGWQPSPPIRATSSPGAASANVGTSSASGTPSSPASTAPAADAPPRVAEPASVAPARSGDAAAPPLPAAPAPKINPDEVTRTLANLADLRDRGAISPEEYEAKKTDLLARL
jgi:hypothetical protein